MYDIYKGEMVMPDDENDKVIPDDDEYVVCDECGLGFYQDDLDNGVCGDCQAELEENDYKENQ